MDSSQEKEIEFRISKTGHLVPVMNQVYLHSIYDPIREAEIFAGSHEQDLQKNPYILLLGLGFGYHVQATLEKLKTYHEKYEVIVIEASIQLATRYIKFCHDKNINCDFKIYSVSPQDLYADNYFLEFLLKRPQVLMHKSSYNKDKEYYASVLKYKASSEFTESYKTLKPELKEILEGYSQESNSLAGIQASILHKPKWSRGDFFIQFAHSLVSTNDSPEVSK